MHQLKARFRLCIVLAAAWCLSWGRGGLAGAEIAWPSIHIKNKVLDLKIYLPDGQNGYYRGPRFDWSGLIARASYGSHQWFGRWQTGKHDPYSDDVVGTAGEFGMGTSGMPPPLGYNEAGAGARFLKIGVGALLKTKNEPYRFYRPYKVVWRAPWKVTSSKTSVKFVQEVKDVNGYGYRYTRHVQLGKEKPEFTIRFLLENTGKKAIHQTYYCHNFTQIDGEQIGPSYEVQFPFRPVPQRGLRDIAKVDGNSILFRRKLKQREALWTDIKGFANTPAHNGFTVWNRRTGAGLRVRGSVTMTQMHFWCTTMVLSPEPFIEIKLAPGEKWSGRTTTPCWSRIVGNELHPGSAGLLPRFLWSHGRGFVELPAMPGP